MPVEASARAVRAEHILDVAAELLGRLGYRRVTVDDVADAAGIGKGTIYLHWKTREALFVAVLLREFLGAMDTLIAGLSADPGNVALHRVTRAQFLQIRNRPLLCAVYVDDSEVLGKLRAGLRKTLDPRHHSAFEDYLTLLGEHAILEIDGAEFCPEASRRTQTWRKKESDCGCICSRRCTSLEYDTL